ACSNQIFQSKRRAAATPFYGMRSSALPPTIRPLRKQGYFTTTRRGSIVSSNLRLDGFQEPVIGKLAAQPTLSRAVVRARAKRRKLDADPEVVHEQSQLIRPTSTRGTTHQNVGQFWIPGPLNTAPALRLGQRLLPLGRVVVNVALPGVGDDPVCSGQNRI